MRCSSRAGFAAATGAFSCAAPQWTRAGATAPTLTANANPRMSLRLDAGVLDHPAPLGELDFHEIIHLLRRTGKRLEAGRAQLLLDLRAVDDLAQLGVELGDDRRRHVARAKNPRPGIHVEALDPGLIHRGQFREQRASLDPSHSESVHRL